MVFSNISMLKIPRFTRNDYTSRGYGCGFYSELIFVESKALKQAHSWLCNCFSNAAIGNKQPIENRNCGRAKYKYAE